jgi:hypothetical protein
MTGKGCGRKQSLPNFWLQGMKERDHMEELNIEGLIILNWILVKQGMRMWTIFLQARIL